MITKNQLQAAINKLNKAWERKQECGWCKEYVVFYTEPGELWDRCPTCGWN